MWVTSSLTSVLTPTAIALGNFDGVHRGHRQVIQPVINQVAESIKLLAQGDILLPETTEPDGGCNIESVMPAIAAPGRVYPTVVTFNPHPQEFFSGQRRSLLTPADEKILQLKAMGVQQLVLLPFDREHADLSPKQFVEEIFVRRLQAQEVSVCIDIRFGPKRS